MPKRHPAAAFRGLAAAVGGLCTLLSPWAHGTPSNRAALARHYDRFLSKDLDRCTTCHRPSDVKSPDSLDEIPHNVFGDRLRLLGEELSAAGKPSDIPARLRLLAAEDSDGDGVSNEAEILVGRNPGVVDGVPSDGERALVESRTREFRAFEGTYRWQPFETVRRPAVPRVLDGKWVRNPVDAFIGAEHERLGLKPRPEASKELLLRRVSLDLIGLSPTRAEQAAFLADTRPDAYERLVDRLLADPRYGERWGRHWMDVWRYSDWAGWTGGNQIRDSQPHIWRWRDWIVESLNADRSYAEMIVEMLAADEMASEDPGALRATGFLVRNYKMLSRELWMEDVVKHTSQAFLGITMGCAKCHDHMTDPISQIDYYRLRAVFDPHHVRIDHVPGQSDKTRDGLARAFDKDPDAPTYRLVRGDERDPDKSKPMVPGVPTALCGQTPEGKRAGRLTVTPVELSLRAAQPERREFVIQEQLAAARHALEQALDEREKAREDKDATEEKRAARELQADGARAVLEALEAVLAVEKMEEEGRSQTQEWRAAAMRATELQRTQASLESKIKHRAALAAVAEAREKLTLAQKENTGEEAKAAEAKAEQSLKAAQKQLSSAEAALAAAEKEQKAELTVKFKPRIAGPPVTHSTGRRLAFARWLADPANPLVARVAVNQIWLRHFGRGIVPNPADFGRGAKSPSHPQLLDWIAAEFMQGGWSMKALHRLLVTSSTYRQSATTDAANAAVDEDNVYLWRSNSRRLEAEAVRDNLLHAAGSLDPTMGGPEIDHTQGLSSKRRSIYLRTAAEKEVEFLKIFDGPAVTECYIRHPSVMPQQALALANSELAFAEARRLAVTLSESAATEETFLRHAFETILARSPTPQEEDVCRDFLRGSSGTASGDPGSAASASRGVENRRENLLLILFNHTDFVTVR